MFKYHLAFISVIALLQTGHAQVNGPAHTFIEKEVVYWDFHSATIKEDYTIYVHVPPGYDTTMIKYPALYITDGDWDKNTAINSFNMLRQDYITNEAVIIGIGYGDRPNQRNRDLEPDAGGPAFLSFIEKEVIPFIESHYRVTDDRTLSGYSYGGLFAAYALFNRPGLFSTVCIGAPAKSNQLVPYAEKYFAKNKDLKARVYLGVGSYEHQTVDNISNFKDYLAKQNCKTLEVGTDIVPHASHGAAKPPVIQDGIEFAFCKKHKAITLSANDLEKYAGTYILAGRPDRKVRFYIEDGKLYAADGGGHAEFVPFKNDSFFMYENQKAEMAFRMENGKMLEFFIPYNGKPIRFERIDLIATSPFKPSLLKSPANWQFEQFSLPPDFAPNVKFHGVEELRFSPGWGKREATDYFTVIFGIRFDDTKSVSPADIRDYLLTYFRGLCDKTAKDRKLNPINTSSINVSIERKQTADRMPIYDLSLHIFGVFTDGGPVTLNAEIKEMEDQVHQRVYLLMIASPLPKTDPVWQELYKVQREFVVPND